MKKSLLVILCITLLFTITFADDTFVSAEIVDSNLISLNSSKVHGSLTVKNNSNLYSPELYYITTLSLLKPTSDSEFSLLMEEPYYQFEPVKFDLGAYEEKTLYFQFTLPDSLPTATYSLSTIISTNTFTLSEVPDIIKLGTVGKIKESLNSINQPYWKIKKIKIDPNSGPTFKINETPIGVIELQSTFLDDIIATPEFTVYKRLKTYEPIPIKIVKGKPVTFKNSETKEVELQFPTFNEPESYEIYVKFLDQNGVQISQEFPFRYVLAGASAKILSTNASYDNITDTIKISINAVGPADSSDLENCSIIYQIYDLADNSLIKEQTTSTTLTSKITEIIETLDNINTNGKIKVDASIQYNGETLATTTTTINLNKTIKSDNELFSDLVGTKYYDAVKFLNSLGILNGYPDGTFKPDNNVTRAEFTVIGTKLANLNANDIKSTLPFSDVSTTHWAKDFITLAYENNIIAGYPDGTFKADNNVSYQEALTILINVMGYKENVAYSKLPWPENYITYAQKLNMMQKLDEINYTAPATRGNIALLTMEAYLKQKEI